MFALLQNICEELNKEGKTWTARKQYSMYYLETQEGVKLAAHEQGDKILFVECLHHFMADNKTAGIAISKGASRIAKELKRRLLGGYEEAYLAKKEEEEKQNQAYEARIYNSGGPDYIFDMLKKITPLLNALQGNTHEWRPLWDHRGGNTIKMVSNSNNTVSVSYTDNHKLEGMRYLIFTREEGEPIYISAAKGPELIAAELGAINL